MLIKIASIIQTRAKIFDTIYNILFGFIKSMVHTLF